MKPTAASGLETAGLVLSEGQRSAYERLKLTNEHDISRLSGLDINGNVKKTICVISWPGVIDF